MSADPRATLLADGCRDLGLDLAADVRTALLRYLDLLIKWNAAFNLTAIRDPQEMVVKHLLDSLAVVPLLPGAVAEHGRLLDVGTGAGLPGIPLALACPGLEVTLLDTNVKKSRFCTQACLDLGLARTRVVHARVELHKAPAFDFIISRAFAELGEFVRVTAHLGGPGTLWLAMKGAAPETELANLPPGFTMRARHPLTVPGLDAERHLVEVVRDGSRPAPPVP